MLRNSPASIPQVSVQSTVEPIATNSVVSDDTKSVKALFESRYVSLGLDPLKVKINEIKLLGNSVDKYIVSYIPSIDYVGGGMYVLIGKQNNKWIMPESGDVNYCNWIQDYVFDEATRSFMGPTCKF